MMDEILPPLAAYEDVAGMIEHAVMRPEASDEDVAEACAIAREYRVAAVTVRPSDVEMAVRAMEGSGVAVGAVVSYPNGCATTAVKLYETNDLLRRGAREIDAVINIGKMLSRQFQYVEMELAQMAQACHGAGAVFKVAFENGYLSQDLKTIACRISRRAGVDYARTSTHFGPAPYSLEDVALMRRLCGDRVKIKASGGVRILDQLKRLRQAGCSRVSTVNTVSILEAWKAELASRAQQVQQPAPSGS